MNDEIINIETANQRFKEVFAPYIQSLNLTVEDINGKGATLRMPYSDDLCRSGQIVCGQALMALVDTCMVFVCYAGLRKYSDVTTVSQNTSFMRPVIGKDVIAEGRIIKAGRNLIFGEVALTVDGDDRSVCTGTSTYAVLQNRSG